MGREATVRSPWGTALFVLIGLSSLLFSLTYNGWDLVFKEHRDTMPMLALLARTTFLLAFASNGSVALMLASFRVLADVYALMGRFMLLTGITLGNLTFMISPLDYYRLVFCAITILTGLVLFIPRPWPISKFILPYHVIKLEDPEV